MLNAHAESARKLAASLFDLWEAWPHPGDKEQMAMLITRICSVVGSSSIPRIGLLTAVDARRTSVVEWKRCSSRRIEMTRMNSAASNMSPSERLRSQLHDLINLYVDTVDSCMHIHAHAHAQAHIAQMPSAHTHAAHTAHAHTQHT